MTNPMPQRQGNKPCALRDAVEIPVISATELLKQGGVIVIEHKGERYRLSLTRSGKLILTK